MFDIFPLYELVDYIDLYGYESYYDNHPKKLVTYSKDANHTADYYVLEDIFDRRKVRITQYRWLKIIWPIIFHHRNARNIAVYAFREFILYPVPNGAYPSLGYKELYRWLKRIFINRLSLNMHGKPSYTENE